MSRHNQGPRLDFLRKRGRYYIVWTENGRSKQRSTSTADREAAEVELAKFLRQRNRRSGPRDPTEVLVTDVLIDYMNDRASKVRAASRIAYAVEPLARFFEGKTIQQAPSNCDAYIKWRREGPKRQIKSGTVRRELNVLRSAVNHAYRVQQLNRIVPFVLPPEGPPRDRWLTRSEAAMLLAGALGFAPTTCEVSTRRPIKWARVAKPLPHLALFILISLLTGRRKEAILSLRWPAVDFKRSIIDFRRPDEPETKKRRGRCSIPDRLLPHLRRAKRFEHDIGPVISWNGKAITDIQTSFAAAADRVFLRGISPHVMRHTAASWLMQTGHDPWKVADFLSMSLTTLLKVYGHHHPDHQSEIARRFGHSRQNVRGIR